MSGLGNLVSGIQGLASGNNQFFSPVPQFFGGITPNMEDLAQYGYQEGLLKDASDFAKTGTGMSTMATQASTGTELGKAQKEGQLSDLVAGAALQAIQTGESASATGNTLNAQSLNSLANAAGTLGKNLASNANFASGFNNPNG